MSMILINTREEEGIDRRKIWHFHTYKDQISKRNVWPKF